MSAPFLALIYLLFFLSGAAALTYQVVWVRSLTLVFGGSHLAVTAVLSIFMGGLAAGGYLAGRVVDRVRRPLRVYGCLELGIAAFALVFVGLMRVYPAVYVALARGRDEATVYLTLVRMLFAVVALIVPTVLMGATLPVLSRFVSRHPEDVRGHLSLLYGVNTLGSVLGALLAGFVFLRIYSVSATLYIAVAANAAIGLASLALGGRTDDAVAAPVVPAAARPSRGEAAPRVEREVGALPVTLVLWGIGISGFCALGYEVLWTRVLTLAVGASVYGFTIILVAFLTGIALGSKLYAAVAAVLKLSKEKLAAITARFGVTQLVIGVTALLVTISIRDIPVNAVRLQAFFLGGGGSFEARMWANFVLAFLYLVVPALFMGAAFPIAGEVVAMHQRTVGRAVGDVLAANTVGAILGAAASGLVMIRLLGIEASLQVLALLNVGLGLTVLASLRKPRWLFVAVAAGTLGAVALVAARPDAFGVWDKKYFAIFRSNQPEAFSTPEKVREAVENTDVLYYAEGVESIVSVIQVKGGERAFVTNGRVEASSHVQAQQIQFTLGHLPALLARDPREVLVVGMGSGMTAGATAVHPRVERVTVVEIEPRVQGVARTFERYNHRVLQNPKVHVVFNDGRNFLLTTDRMFDVITADPIHPWFRGAGYLYASEYFELAARHLRPGGVMAQWLPIYELTPRDLASVVRTVRQHFAHTMMWLTHFDAVIVGSNSPFVVDEEELQKRLEAPEVAADLRNVMMGSATDFLSYFVMGTDGMKRFAETGIVNSDDRLYLEFSAPFSIATPAVMAEDIAAIAAHRESLLPYLRPAEDAAARQAQQERWNLQLQAGRRGDRALALYLGSDASDPAVAQALLTLTRQYPWYAPAKALWAERQATIALEPRLLQAASFPLAQDDGAATELQMAAVLVPVSPTRASVMFVDNRARAVFGQRYFDDYDRDGRANQFAIDVMSAVRRAYDEEVVTARQRKQTLPPASQTERRIKAVIGSKVQSGQPRS